jgi:hypothetical protein
LNGSSLGNRNTNPQNTESNIRVTSINLNLNGEENSNEHLSTKESERKLKTKMPKVFKYTSNKSKKVKSKLLKISKEQV